MTLISEWNVTISLNVYILLHNIWFEIVLELPIALFYALFGIFKIVTFFVKHHQSFNER